MAFFTKDINILVYYAIEIRNIVNSQILYFAACSDQKESMNNECICTNFNKILQ